MPTTSTDFQECFANLDIYSFKISVNIAGVFSRVFVVVNHSQFHHQFSRVLFLYCYLY